MSTKIEVVGDHVPPGTRHPDWPEFNPGEKVAVVRIEGDGGGGSGNALERAIDPFFENWTTSGSIVQQHQGLVTINGVPESGVVVKIMLPAAKPDEP